MSSRIAYKPVWMRDCEKGTERESAFKLGMFWIHFGSFCVFFFVVLLCFVLVMSYRNSRQWRSRRNRLISAVLCLYDPRCFQSSRMGGGGGEEREGGPTSITGMNATQQEKAAERFMQMQVEGAEVAQRQQESKEAIPHQPSFSFPSLSSSSPSSSFLSSAFSPSVPPAVCDNLFDDCFHTNIAYRDPIMSVKGIDDYKAQVGKGRTRRQKGERRNNDETYQQQ